MSSFKRRASGKKSHSYVGTRLSAASSSTTITSTGIPSLDDILGGGLPLSCSLLIAAPDHHSSYGELIQKYFIAEGLACGHQICIVGNNVEKLAREIMWYPRSSIHTMREAESDEEHKQSRSEKVSIAWRYEQMKPFRTTVSSHSLDEDSCHTFDLSSIVPETVINDALRSKKMSLLNVCSSNWRSSITSNSDVLLRLTQYFDSAAANIPSAPVRICIPSFGSLSWGNLESSDILHFLHSLKALLRKYSHACASISLSSHISNDAWGGPGWIQKLGWMSDAAITLDAFSVNPALSTVFPLHQGIIKIHTLPMPHTLVPPSDRFSALRGFSGISTGAGGGGENNLAFKSTRKRLLFETLHLDLEGGVSERRSTPAVNMLHKDSLAEKVNYDDERGRGHKRNDQIEVALEPVPVQFEHMNLPATIIKGQSAPETKQNKTKKQVAFQSERPDLYDF